MSKTGSNKRKLNGPTLLTILRMVLSIVFLIFVLQPSFGAKLISLVVFVIAAITDKIDGMWARRGSEVTELGAFLDPLADKMLVNLAFLALVSLGVVPVWVFAVVLVRDFAVDGLRMAAAKKDKVISASVLGKLKTAFQMAALILLIFGLVVNWTWLNIFSMTILYIAVILTVISAADYFWRYK